MGIGLAGLGHKAGRQEVERGEEAGLDVSVRVCGSRDQRDSVRSYFPIRGTMAARLDGPTSKVI